MYKRKTMILIMICIVLLISTGCWDKLEINERSFITAIGFDKNEKYDKISDQKDIYEISLSIANVKQVATGEGDPSALLIGTGTSILDVMGHILSTTSKYTFLGHTKVAIISEELLKEGDSLKEILDGLERNPFVTRRINLVVANDAKAREILSIHPEEAEQIGFYINEMLSGKKRPGRFNPETLGEFIEHTIKFNCGLLPRITVDDEDVVIYGSAVIKDYKLVNYIDWVDTRSLMFINNQVDVEDINILYNKTPIPYIINDSKAKKIVEKKDDILKVTIELQVEGALQQYKLDTKHSLFDNKKLESIESEIEKTLERQLKSTIDLLQNDIGVDLIRLGDYLSKFKPKLWKEYEGNWDDEFKNVVFDVKVDAKIRRIGMTK